MGQAHSRQGVYVTAVEDKGNANGADNKHQSASIYLAACGQKAGITPTTADRSIVITDIINGASGSPLELAYKDDADASASGRKTVVVMESATSHTFFMPLRIPQGKFLHFHAGAKVTIHYYED